MGEYEHLDCGMVNRKLTFPFHNLLRIQHILDIRCCLARLCQGFRLEGQFLVLQVEVV